MHFLRPDATWLFLLLVIPVILYLLPLPRRRMMLASTLVWRKAIQGGMLARRRRLWRVLASIAMASAVVALIVAALGRMMFVRRPDASGVLAVVLDTSASMQASEDGVSRFERARKQAVDFVESLETSEGDRLLLVTTAPAAEVVVRGTDDPSLLVEALRRLKPGDAPGSIATTLKHLDAALEDSAHVHVFTDGAETLARDAADNMHVNWHVVRGAAANAGIVAFGARRVESPKPALFAQARLANFADTPRNAVLRLHLDNVAVEPRSVEIPAQSEVAVAWTLPSRESARLDLEMAPHDAFALDDGAAVVLGPERRRRVVVVAEKPPLHLLAALRADDTVRAFLATPASYRPNIQSDLTIFIGGLPQELGPGNVLLVNPAATTSLVELTGEEIAVAGATLDPGVPLVRDLAWRPGLVKSAAGIKTPSCARSVLWCDAGPLVLTGEVDGRKAVVLAFDPETQPIAKTRTFPVLVRNIVDALAPPAGGASSRAVAGLLSAGESDLRTRIDTRGAEMRATVSPAAIWAAMILASIALLVIEAFLYHRQSVE